MTSRASAKIILFGEHAVVYGYPAIAVPFGALTVTVNSRIGPRGQGLAIFARNTRRKYRVTSTAQTSRDGLAYAAQLILRELRVPPPDLILNVRSAIPIASGLGSGAAVTTALMRELSSALGSPLSPERLNPLVYEVEKMYHGTPSGIDNTVIVYERPVYFKRGTSPEHFRIGAALTLIVADSGIPGSTHEAVSAVRALYDADPVRIGAILAQIGALVDQARSALEAGDQDTFGRLMIENQRHLDTLTVSLPTLETLIGAARDAGALGAKLSGGGRGGNVIALVTAQSAGRVRDALLGAGAVHAWQTEITE